MSIGEIIAFLSLAAGGLFAVARAMARLEAIEKRVAAVEAELKARLQYLDMIVRSDERSKHQP